MEVDVAGRLLEPKPPPVFAPLVFAPPQRPCDEEPKPPAELPPPKLLPPPLEFPPYAPPPQPPEPPPAVGGLYVLELSGIGGAVWPVTLLETFAASFDPKEKVFDIACLKTVSLSSRGALSKFGFPKPTIPPTTTTEFRTAVAKAAVPKAIASTIATTTKAAAASATATTAKAAAAHTTSIAT